MTTQQVIALVSAILGSGALGTVLTLLLSRKKTKAETSKLKAEKEAILAEAEKTKAEAKKLESEAASTLSDAVSDIVSGFQSLIKQSESRCKIQINDLESHVKLLQSEYDRLKIDNENNKATIKKLEEKHSLAIDYIITLATHLTDNNIDFPEPPTELKIVIPRNGNNHLEYSL